MFFQPQIDVKPVGYVRARAISEEVKDKMRISEIVILPELSEALDGLADYSHVYVLFWLHEISREKRLTLKIYPRGREDLPLVGVFAVRSNIRPNPIGLTVVELLKVEGNVVTVRGLDAFDGTPVLDIKPYDSWDVVKDVKVPGWWLTLEDKKPEKVAVLKE